MLFKDYINQEDKNAQSFDFYRDCFYKVVEEKYGLNAAALISLGSTCFATIEEVMEILETKPKGTHLGELEEPEAYKLIRALPTKFLTRYDYEFLYDLWCKYHQMSQAFYHDKMFQINSVLDELIVFVCVSFGTDYCNELRVKENIVFDDVSESLDWIGKYFGNYNLLDCLYPVRFYPGKIQLIDENHPYHFNNWNVPLKK